MEVKINKIELASELAHDMAKDEMFRNELITDEDDMFINGETEDIIIYTEEAQDIFNRWFDYFISEISSIEIK
jgi:phosphoserine phosphatase